VRNRDDSQAWAAFTRLYEPLLLRYVRRRGFEENDARDLVQDIFIKLVQCLNEFEYDRQRGRFRAWLFRMTERTIIDTWRRRGRRGTAKAELEDVAESQESFEEQWNQEYRQRIMEHVLQEVREESQSKTWTCFQEHLLNGRPADDVARELQLSRNAVYTNASRILKVVRERCAEFEENLEDQSIGA
jgi:RNA polymerase sigma-70 factor (ECF subfamily)